MLPAPQRCALLATKPNLQAARAAAPGLQTGSMPRLQTSLQALTGYNTASQAACDAHLLQRWTSVDRAEVLGHGKCGRDARAATTSGLPRAARRPRLRAARRPRPRSGAGARARAAAGPGASPHAATAPLPPGTPAACRPAAARQTGTSCCLQALERAFTQSGQMDDRYASLVEPPLP